MFSNAALNAFCQSTFDQSFVDGENRGPCIDENGAIDDDMLELDIARQPITGKRDARILADILDIFVSGYF